MAELLNLNAGLMDQIVPYFKVLGAIAIGKYLISLVDNWVAGRRFRSRGFRVGDTVKVDDDIATITRIGIWDTDFRIEEVNESRDEYLAIPNTRLPFIKIRRLVRKYNDHKEVPYKEAA